MSIFDPIPDEVRSGLDVAISTFPAGWERLS